MTLCTYGPPAERQRRWIIKFDDTDMGDLHYTVEADAMRAWDRYKDTWTCTLFVTAEFVDYDRRAEMERALMRSAMAGMQAVSGR